MSVMLYENGFTHFAPAERASMDCVIKQFQTFDKLQDIKHILDSLPYITMVLNQQRQVVYCNQALLELLNIKDSGRILGARPGEVLKCIHARENQAGCGTSESCSTCGAVLAVLGSLKGEKSSQECRITVQRDEEYVSLDLHVSANPFFLEGEDYIIISITDISDEKRKKALERIFFHDIINTAGGLRSIVELMGYIDEPAKVKELLKDLTSVADTLMEEILEQRDLISAENNELRVKKEPIQSRELLEEIVKQFKNHQVAKERILKIDDTSENVFFANDPILIRRVLGNMLKNALEASSPGDTVTAGVKVTGQQLEFWVNNPMVMPREVQLQIFKRSFSTKGKGRGLGTYSMKLLTERYLKGTVSFNVCEEKGTTFLAAYPIYLMD